MLNVSDDTGHRYSVSNLKGVVVTTQKTAQQYTVELNIHKHYDRSLLMKGRKLLQINTAKPCKMGDIL